MTALYLTEPGTSLVRRGDQLVVWKSSVALTTLPVAQVDHVVVAGSGIQVTSAALSLLAGRGIDVAYLTRHGKLLGRFSAPQRRDASRRIAQYRAVSDRARRLQLARFFVAAKITNQGGLLRKRGSAEAGRRLEEYAAQARRAPTVESVMGVEGAASRVYFGAWRRLLPAGLAFGGRAYHPPPDVVNAALSLAYTLLLKDVLVSVEGAGLDPHLGFLHEVGPAKPSLALDLMEELRPLIADSLVLEMARRNLLKPSRDEKNGVVLLGDGPRGRLYALYEARMAMKRRAWNGTRATYRRCVALQAEQLAAVIARDRKSYEPLGWA